MSTRRRALHGHLEAAIREELITRVPGAGLAVAFLGGQWAPCPTPIGPKNYSGFISGGKRGVWVCVLAIALKTTLGSTDLWSRTMSLDRESKVDFQDLSKRNFV